MWNHMTTGWLTPDNPFKEPFYLYLFTFKPSVLDYFISNSKPWLPHYYKYQIPKSDNKLGCFLHYNFLVATHTILALWQSKTHWLTERRLCNAPLRQKPPAYERSYFQSTLIVLLIAWHMMRPRGVCVCVWMPPCEVCCKTSSARAGPFPSSHSTQRQHQWFNVVLFQR